VALVALAFAFAVGLMPPSVVKDIGTAPYVLVLLALSLGLSVGIPMVFWISRKPGWVAPNAAAYLESGEDQQNAPAPDEAAKTEEAP